MTLPSEKVTAGIAGSLHRGRCQVFINRKLGELNLKVVYYGPSLSGKTTNLEYIHANIDPKLRSELVSLKTHGDRTLFFDFLQLELGRIRGLKPKFNLYTVPGQVIYTASRKLVLEGADGVVFVADSQADRLRDNSDLMGSLATHLSNMGHRVTDYPIVLQCNKQDLPDALPPENLRSRLRQDDMPCLGSVATEGVGVFETLKMIINLVVGRIF
ncbi:MAG: gliding-motility protein MglA [Anaerolineae bacterium]|nr:gliding-motility protein MglA [Anaerolineae bacterium]NIN95763.1 gliding-motility protein MglA [Anaerolineae bacterium]NIQ78738.1 gliding-motility protein MglA [Anaerolineae bacterium]